MISQKMNWEWTIFQLHNAKVTLTREDGIVLGSNWSLNISYKYHPNMSSLLFWSKWGQAKNIGGKYLHFCQGWEFALWFFERIAHLLWVKEQNSYSLLEKSKLLPSLFYKEWWERRATGVVRSKKREKQWKTVQNMVKNTIFLERIAGFCKQSLTSLFLKSNHERFAHVTLL